jgi:hypothetical protein
MTGTLVLPKAVARGSTAFSNFFQGVIKVGMAHNFWRDLCGLASGKTDRTITEPHDTNGESFWNDHSVIIAAIPMHSTQVVLVNCGPDSPAQASSCVLVGSKMNSAVNASVRNVVGNLPE